MSFEISCKIVDCEGYPSIESEGIDKLIKKHRIAARMIAERIRNENKAWSEYRGVYSDLVDLKDAFKYMVDLNEKNHEYLKKLQKEIEELQEENELINLENAHLEGKIAAYEKILKIEN